MIPKHNLVAVGGTFDHLHKGHEAFLRAAFFCGKRVLIGLTSDEMTKKKFHPDSIGIKFQMQNFQTRKQKLLDLLDENNWLDRAEIVKIDDLYGPTLKRNDIEALVVTTETLQGARLINKKRIARGLPKFPVILLPLVLAQDRARIASTRIRGGDIDRYGRLYRKLPLFGGKVPEVVRMRLKKPLGKVVKDGVGTDSETFEPPIDIGAPAMLITVGDIVTRYLNENDPQIIDIAIVDFRVNRKAIHTSMADVGFTYEKIRNYIVTSVKNPPGYITKTLVRAVDRAIKRRLTERKRSIIRVIGEEDLAGVPAILLAPLGAVVLYGQPDEGMVVVEVTEEKKKEMVKLLQTQPIR